MNGLRLSHRHHGPYLETRALLAVGLMAAPVLQPPLLLPIAQGYQAACERFPTIALMTFHTPASSMALLLTLFGLMLGSILMRGACLGAAAIHINVRLSRAGATIPPRLARSATTLGIGKQITFIGEPTPAVYCYGMLRPRVTITSGMLDRLDDAALMAVLAHERHHMRRRDPFRFVLLQAIAAPGATLPAIPALCDRLQTQMELAADRAALTVSSRYDLAAALQIALLTPDQSPIGATGLTATEARITQLTGKCDLPTVPLRPIIATIGMLVVAGASAVALGISTDLVPMLCHYCDKPG